MRFSSSTNSRSMPVTLVKRGTVQKTSSGKIKRRATREAFLAGELSVVAQWQATLPQPMAATLASPTLVPEPEPEPPVRETRTRLVTGERRCLAIERFLRERVARLAKLSADALDSDAPLAQYGVDSLAASEIAEALEAWLGEPVPTTISYDHHDDPRHRARARSPTAAAVSSSAEQPRCSPASDGGLAWPSSAWRAAFPARRTWASSGRCCNPASTRSKKCRKSARWDVMPHASTKQTRAAPGQTPDRFGGFLRGIEDFDAEFFGISPREAARMDPQQRLFLELTWRALEDAGIAPESLAGSDTGVFAAVCGSEHALVHGADLERVDADFGTGHSASVVANRVSYFLDLRRAEPWPFDEYARASSLVALQAACQSLASGEIQLAIVGGVNAVLAPHAGLFFCERPRTAPTTGRCKTVRQAR